MSGEARSILDQHVTEDELLEAVVEMAERFKWRVSHIPDKLYKLAAKEQRWDAMRGAKSFPDLVMVRRGVLIFAETKTEAGELDPGQAEWHSDIEAVQQLCWDWDEFCPVLYYLWRPSHLSSGEIERTLR